MDVRRHDKIFFKCLKERTITLESYTNETTLQDEEK